MVFYKIQLCEQVFPPPSLRLKHHINKLKANIKSGSQLRCLEYFIFINGLFNGWADP